MRQGRALDSDIALLLHGKRPAKPENIPFYSSNLYDAYKVVNALQTKGWHFNIKSNIEASGTLIYHIKFSQGNMFSEIHHSNIALAICNCAVKIANGETEQWEDPNRTYGISEISQILESNLDNFPLPSDSELKFSDILGEENAKKLPREMASFILDILESNNLVIKKTDDGS